MFRSFLPKLLELPPPQIDFGLDFRIIESVGGRVYKAIHDSGRIIAVKKIQIPEDGSNENQIKKLEDEVRNLQLLSHPNIVQYLGTRRVAGSLCILMEFWGKSDCSKELRLFNETKTRRFTIQLLQGLQYLHERTIVHGNIKGRNILVDAFGDIKLADFGLSANSNLLGAQSSSGYRHAVEIFQPLPHLDPSADIWCVGCIMIELTTGKDPWRRESWSNYILPKKFSFHAKNFLQECLQWEQQDSRLPTFVLLQHPFLNPASIEVRPTQLLPRESLVAEVLYCTSPSPTYAAVGGDHSRLILDQNSISGDEGAAEPSHNAEPPIMQRPNQAFALQHGAGAPVSLTLSSNVGSTPSTNSESISSPFGSGVTFVSDPSSHSLTSSTTCRSSCPNSKSNTSDSKSISTLVPILDPNSTCFQKEAYVRTRRSGFLKFLCFYSP
ncbi:mitogen-activated protein kinase kinase kinase NPK1-like [Rosa sericea]